MNNYPPGSVGNAPWLEDENDCNYIDEYGICEDCPDLDDCPFIDRSGFEEWKEENGKC